MILSRARETLRTLSVLFSALLLGAAAAAQADEAVAEPETAAPNYLGLELPLRPGERVLPTADGSCSVVVYAPHEELYTRLAAFWSKANWNGYCRFGLAHGKGTISGTEGDWSIDTAMVYGLEVNPAEVTTTEVGKDGALSWISPSDMLHYFSGSAYSDPDAKRYVIRLGNNADDVLELDDLATDWYGTDYLERHTFNDEGREWVMSVSAWNVDTYCGLGLPAEFKPFEKEVRKACKSKGKPLVLFRREGLGADPWTSRKIAWLKSCPYNKMLRVTDCGKIVMEAVGDDAKELEAMLVNGDEAARTAAKQEILDRYAPLEAVVEEPLLVDDEG